MKKKKKTGTGDNNKLIAIIAVAIGLVLAVSIALYFILYYSNNYVGKVDGAKMYDYEFTNYVEREVNALSQEADIPEDATQDEQIEALKKFFTEQDKDGKYALDRVKDNALEELRRVKVEAALAKEAGYTLTSEEESNVKQNVDLMINYYYSMYQQQGAGTSYEDVQRMVCGSMSIDQYKTYVMQDTVVQKWKEALKEGYEVTDADARAVYDENPDAYKGVTVQKLFLSTQTENEEGKKVDMTAEEKAAVLEKANDYMYKFADGSLDFEATIKAESDEENSSDNSGITTITASSSSGSKNLDKWAFTKTKADDDDVYTVVEDDNGVYVVKCTKVTDFDNSEDVPADPDKGIAEQLGIKSTIINEIKADKADKEVADKADAAMKDGYKVTDLNNSRINELVVENQYVKQLIEAYGAKYSK